jgi:hypothetical protein
MSSHTPGPWMVFMSSNQIMQVVMEIKNQHGLTFAESIAFVQNFGGMTESNAYLIAAAPELLQEF